jgi:hypothetical protein
MAARLTQSWTRLRLTSSLVALLALAGCSTDPFDKPGTWSVPTDTVGSNDANLRVMLVNPRDLVAGQGEPNSAGPAAATPVRKLLTGRRPALPQSGISSVKVGGSAEPQQSAPAASPTVIPQSQP